MGNRNEILRYWFGDKAAFHDGPGRFPLWFGKSPETDREIRKRFGKDLERAGREELEDWKKEPESCLALIVLLDQFPRNIFRGSPKAFAFDEKVRQICRDGLERGFDSELPIFGRLFFYLPLEHSESLDDQERSVALFGALLNDAPTEKTNSFRLVYEYALRHREIIARFGRFPHRNEVLGRPSTPGELEFLKEPGSSF